ncbi:MAG: zinc-ribbon domain-containing protein [Gammaproteobacteria bacterium]|nr:zinc-ribbon domain-containing protein [Gammaproteobacteria bacterium]
MHNGPSATLPTTYADFAFRCEDCDRAEVWTAASQKWWYEVAKGSIYSIAVRCRACRQQERLRKQTVRLAHLQGIEEKSARL